MSVPWAMVLSRWQQDMYSTYITVLSIVLLSSERYEDALTICCLWLFLSVPAVSNNSQLMFHISPVVGYSRKGTDKGKQEQLCNIHYLCNSHSAALIWARTYLVIFHNYVCRVAILILQYPNDGLLPSAVHRERIRVWHAVVCRSGGHHSHHLRAHVQTDAQQDHISAHFDDHLRPVLSAGNGMLIPFIVGSSSCVSHNR